ncbi:hypothetical protein KAR91_34285 [Candidatus Pacearchaeota archaeon]|nr:hypothetical protein [Candidatus Pacearchaeota archaeon]
MKNIDMVVKDNKLVITVDLTEEHGLSKSEKNVIIATTGGNADVPGMEEKDVKIGLNVYRKA